jgi:hypothetical protein
MAPGDLIGCCCDWSRNGLRETGRAAGEGSSKGDTGPSSISEGEGAPLRNGLLEDKLMLRLTSSRERVVLLADMLAVDLPWCLVE